MLSIFLTCALESRCRDDVVYFFCSSLDENHSKAAAILRSLIWQIISKRPGLARLISPYFEEDGERTQAVLTTPGMLWEMFASLLDQVELTPMYCVLDGFDECDDVSTHWLAAKLATLSRDSKQNNMRILVVSRDLPALWHIKQKILIDPDNNDKIGADIEIFTTTKMLELSQRLNLSEDFVGHIHTKLLEKSEATFLWIGYAVNELMAKSTSLQVQEVIDGLPNELGSLYSRMLYNIPPDKVDLVASVLCWAILAARPLSLLELAAAIEQHMPQHFDSEQTARECVALCTPLIALQGETVALVHQSAKDYFLRRDEDVDPVLETFRIKAADAHLILAETCLSKLDGDSPLAAYACSYWPEHARQCASNEELLVTRNNHFFAKASKLREQWWQQYVRHDKGYNENVYPDRHVPRLHMACYLGLERWAEAIINRTWRFDVQRTMITEVDGNGGLSGQTPLNLAILAGRTNMVTYLLSRGVNPNLGTVLSSALHLAVKLRSSDEIMDLLLSHGGLNWLLLLSSIEWSNLETTRLALERGADPDKDDRCGNTALMKTVQTWRAARNAGYPDDQMRGIARLLLQAGADPNRRNDFKKTAIQYASNDMEEELRGLFEEFGHQEEEAKPNWWARTRRRIVNLR